MRLMLILAVKASYTMQCTIYDAMHHITMQCIVWDTRRKDAAGMGGSAKKARSCKADSRLCGRMRGNMGETIYYQDSEIRIRNMRDSDIPIIVEEEIAQGWHASSEKYEQRLLDQRDGKAVSLVAEKQGRPVGYINVYWDPRTGAYANKGIPEIVDFGVLEKYRNQGIGTRMMDTAERLASTHCPQVCLGVGLHSGYGSAQRMYVKRGYIPDGSGVWFRDEICTPYGECYNDDDLVLYLQKTL